MTNGKQDLSFLPLDKADISAMTIPDVFSYANRSSWEGITLACFVEYYLEAEVVTTRQDSFKATLPLLIQSPAIALQRADYAMHGNRSRILIPVSNLFTGKQLFDFNPKRKFFSRSESFDFRYRLEMQYPARVQLGSRIPFLLCASPVITHADAEAEWKRHPPALELRLESIKLTIQSTTTGLTPGTWGPKKASMVEKYVVEWNHQFSNKEPIRVPFGETELMNVGNALDLVLKDDGVWVLGKRHGPEFKPRLLSDLKSFGIQHTHQFIWNVGIALAGVKKRHEHEARIETDVEVVGPCQETMDSMLSALTEEQRKEYFRNVIMVGKLGADGIDAVNDLVQAFAG